MNYELRFLGTMNNYLDPLKVSPNFDGFCSRFYSSLIFAPQEIMRRNVVKKKKPVAGWSIAVILYVLSGSLCVSYPLFIAPISWWAQGTNNASLECCKNADKLLQFYRTDVLHVHGYGFMDKLGCFDPCAQASLSISKRKIESLKNANIGGFFGSLVLFFCSTGSMVFSYILLLVLGLEATHSLCILVVCAALAVVQCKLFHYFVHVVTCTKGNCKCIHEQVILHMLNFFWENSTLCIAVHAAKVLISRSLISILLLMSGDIESNPGPPADRPPSRSSSTSSLKSQLFQSFSEESSSTSESSPQNQSPPKRLHIHPSQPTSADESTDRRSQQYSTSELRPPTILSVENVDNQFEIRDSTKEPSPPRVRPAVDVVDYRHTQTERVPTLGIGKVLSTPKPATDGPATVINPSGIDKPECDDRFQFEKAVPPPSESASNRYSELETGREKWQISGALDLDPAKLESKERKLFDICTEQDKKYHPEEQKHKHCPTCLEECPDAACRSHIIPKGILETFHKIHCAAADYIFNLTTGGRQGAKAIAYYMLCRECERRYCDEELMLLKMYRQIMNNPKNQRFIVPNDDDWLQFVLAIILLRGLLVNVDLVEFFKCEQFWSVFRSLWRYCAKKDDAYPPDIRLVLATDNPFTDTQMRDFSFSLELARRSFMFTTLCRQDGGQSFLYTKFDCFHIVLPLIGCSSIGTTLTAGASSWELQRSELPEVLIKVISSELAKRDTNFRTTAYRQTTPHIKVLYDSPGPLTTNLKTKPAMVSDDEAVIINLEKKLKECTIDEAIKHSPLRSPAEELKGKKTELTKARKMLDKTKKEFSEYRKNTKGEIEALKIALDSKVEEARKAKETAKELSEAREKLNVDTKALTKALELAEKESETLTKDLDSAKTEIKIKEAELEKERWEAGRKIAEKEADVLQLVDMITNLQLRAESEKIQLKSELLWERFKKSKETFKTVKLKWKIQHGEKSRISVISIKKEFKEIIDEVEKINDLATMYTPELQDQCKDFLSEVVMYSRIHVRSVTVSW